MDLAAGLIGEQGNDFDRFREFGNGCCKKDDESKSPEIAADLLCRWPLLMGGCRVMLIGSANDWGFSRVQEGVAWVSWSIDIVHAYLGECGGRMEVWFARQWVRKSVRCCVHTGNE